MTLLSHAARLWNIAPKRAPCVARVAPLVAAEAVEEDPGGGAHRQMVVSAGAEYGRQCEVGALEHRGRHPEAGAEQQHDRRGVGAFEARAHLGIAETTAGACRSVHDERTCSRDALGLDDRLVEIRPHPDEIEGL